MRLWISPDQLRIELEDGVSHSATVVADPSSYGIDPDAMERYMRSLDDDDTDAPFDFDTVIALAEMGGWVRVSKDASRGGLAVSASAARQARKAIRHLEADGFHLGAVQLQLEIVDGPVIRSEFRTLDEDQVAMFVRHGRLPAVGQNTLHIEAVDLVTAVLEARASGIALLVAP